MSPRRTLTPLQQETLALLLPDDAVVLPRRYLRTAARMRTIGWLEREEGTDGLLPVNGAALLGKEGVL